MSFWNLGDTPVDGKFETGGGDMEPIPAKTQVLAAPDEAKWDEYQGDRYISLRWSVMAPAEYKNRKIFQKIRVEDSDPKKAEKAKRMLAAIDANAGGKLVKSGKEPDDKALTMSLVNKPMVLMLQVWEIDKEQDGTPIPKEDRKKGNWVSAVSPRKGSPKKEEPAPEPEPLPTDFDEDVGF